MNYTRKELKEILSDLEGILGHYQARHYNSIFPSIPLMRVAHLLRQAEELKNEADKLMSEIKTDVACRVEIEQHLSRLGLAIAWIRKAGRKSLLTPSKVKSIMATAAMMASRHK